MHYLKAILLLGTIFLFMSKHLCSQTEEGVRTMINAGQDLNNLAQFSSDNSTLAMVNSSKVVEIYDVKSGFLIRKVPLTEGSLIQELLFDENNKLLIHFAFNKYISSIDLQTGSISKIEKEKSNFQISEVPYDPMGQSWMKFYTHVTTNKSKEFFYYESPDSKYKIGIKSITSDTLIPTLKVSVFTKGKETILIDTLTQYVFMKVFFSKDSKYVLIDNRIYNLDLMQLVSKIDRIGTMGAASSFIENTNTPYVMCETGMLRLDNFQFNQNVLKGAKIYTMGNGYAVNKYDLDLKKTWLSTYNKDLSLELTNCEIGITNIIEEISANGQYFLAKNFSTNMSYSVYDVNTCSLIKDLSYYSKESVFTFAQNDLIINSNDTCVKINLKTRDSLIYYLPNFFENEEYVRSKSKDGYVFKFLGSGNLGKVWNLATGEMVAQFEYSESLKSISWQIAFDIKNNEIILYKTNQTIQVIDLNTGKLKKEFIGHSGTVTQYIPSTDGSNGLTNSSDGKTILWDIKSNTKIAEIILKDADNYVIISAENYYLYRNYGGHFVHFAKGKKVFPLEQFDLKYNRPDIILGRLGYADSSLVNTYYVAYQKRLKKMGFTEDMLEDDFHLPEIKIENYEEMPTINDNGSIQLDLKLEDTKYKLDRINVWVNDVAIYGANGISVRDRNVQKYSTSLNVNLANGKNKVQVSVLNQAGAESYKETFEIECTAGKKQADLYLITIGESKFQQSEFDLTYAAKDAEDISKLLANSKAYAQVFSKTLTNEEVTKENILALKSFLNQADINDQVMIFIAGHGVLDANLDYYFATYDMDFHNPVGKGLAYDDLESLLDGIKPLKKTLMIDACHSGEIDKEEVVLAQAEIKTDNHIQFRTVGNSPAPKLGMQNTSELTKSLFTDLRKGTGATVISSAGGMEFAMEGADWNNGLFTYCFINGIQSKAADLDKNGEIWLSEIQEYVGKQVTLLSGGRQQPTSRIENQVVDFRLW